MEQNNQEQKEGVSTFKNEDEQKRFENFEYQKRRLLAEGYKEENKVISVVKANVMAFVTAGPFAILVLVLYLLIWNEANMSVEMKNVLVFMVVLFIGIFIHELIHGITWSLFCKNGWKSIHIGMIKEYLTPYCHCKEPLTFGSYIIGGLMPFLILGIGVSAVGILVGNFTITFIGIVNILSAGGDTTIALMLLKYRNAVIIDHPKECGFVAFIKE